MTRQHEKGFTLLEMLLVMAIISSVLILLLNYSLQRTNELRRNRASLQIQQILNAALSYYVNNSQWPIACGNSANPTPWKDVSTTDLSLYLPNLTKNPYQQPYYINCAAQTLGGAFYVKTTLDKATDAIIVAGKLPVAFAAADSPKVPTSSSNLPSPNNKMPVVYAAISVPAQNLNNARSTNFAGIYHNGACVPAPICPGANDPNPPMTPQIFVSVAGVTGANDGAAIPPQQAPNIYPISSFTAYAQGSSPLDNNPPPCTPSQARHSCPNTAGIKYWRVCLAVVTSKGDIYQNYSGPNANSPGQYQEIIAVTRCSPKDESAYSGSNFEVWTP